MWRHSSITGQVCLYWFHDTLFVNSISCWSELAWMVKMCIKACIFFFFHPCNISLDSVLCCLFVNFVNLLPFQLQHLRNPTDYGSSSKYQEAYTHYVINVMNIFIHSLIKISFHFSMHHHSCSIKIIKKNYVIKKRLIL